MPDIVCTCIYEAYIDKSTTFLTTVVDLVFSISISVLGIIVNYKLIRNLKEEKRSKPVGRKGNVIEPIMQIYCKFQIVFWPYYLLYFWLQFNGIIPSSLMNGWWCNVIMQISIVFGRTYIAWISLFVALTRYTYIVHRETANRWDYERVGMIFKICSVVVPIVFGVMRLFTDNYNRYQTGENFESCIAFHLEYNSTSNITIPTSYPYTWTLKYIPENILLGIDYALTGIDIIVSFNIAEAYLYLVIFRQIKR